ncbi:MAG: hypothetical protein K6D97_02560 [Clostridia bacterium]|nr:hypothetical protein [Clostridia bacterium]
MEDNLVEAMTMAFSAIIFIIALTLTMYMFSKVTYTSEVLTANADTTRFYENVEMKNIVLDEDNPEQDELKKDILDGKVKIIDSSSIIPTLYRYYKENFCVKIYDATRFGPNRLSTDIGNHSSAPVIQEPRLIQVFDMAVEGKVNEAIGYYNARSDTAISQANSDEERVSRIRNNILINAYNSGPSTFSIAKVHSDSGSLDSAWLNYTKENRLYLFGAPWVGSTENTKKRIDYFINGSDGYINIQYVNYVDNPFALAIRAKDDSGNPLFAFTERVISYSYTGSTEETEEGDVLVNGAASKDKLVIIYTIIDNDAWIVRSANR